jgi:hypothetical protein
LEGRARVVPKKRTLGLASDPLTERRRETFYGFGGNVGRVTPDPIPNSEVKPVRADGTAGAALWESRTLPELWKPRLETDGAFFFKPSAVSV